MRDRVVPDVRIRPLARGSLVEQVIAEIRKQVAAGTLSDGQRLPTEADMARDLGISRPLLREALARLRSEGYVHTVSGIGSFVRVPTVDDLSTLFVRQLELPTMQEGLDADALYEARTTLESATVRLAAVRATDATVEELADFVARMRRFEGERAEYIAADVGFHVAIAYASGNPLYPVLLRPLVSLIVEGMFESHGTARATAGGIAGHTQILNAIRHRRPAAAVRAMTQHLAESRSVYPEPRPGLDARDPVPPAATAPR